MLHERTILSEAATNPYLAKNEDCIRKVVKIEVGSGVKDEALVGV